MEVDFYFFADERERYWNRKIPLVREGRLPSRRAASVPRRGRGGDAWPGARAQPAPLRRRRQVAQRAADAPAGVRHEPRAQAAVRPVDRDVAPPAHRLPPRQPAAHPPRLSRRRVDRRLRRTRRALPRRDGRASTPGRSSWPAKRSSPSASPPSSRRATACPRRFIPASSKNVRASPTCSTPSTRSTTPARACDWWATGRLSPRSSGVPPWTRAWDVVGYLPQQRLPETLAGARCLVLPSVTTALDREPWGLVVNEAMHAGVPVIATDAVGAARRAAWSATRAQRPRRPRARPGGARRRRSGGCGRGRASWR